MQSFCDQLLNSQYMYQCEVINITVKNQKLTWWCALLCSPKREAYNRRFVRLSGGPSGTLSDE